MVALPAGVDRRVATGDVLAAVDQDGESAADGAAAETSTTTMITSR